MDQRENNLFLNLIEIKNNAIPLIFVSLRRISTKGLYQKK